MSLGVQECKKYEKQGRAPLKLKSGDKIKFGKKYCRKTGRKDLLGKSIMLTPQYFDEYNGLYCYQSECPGIWNESENEADSIYHLFGNSLEDFLDCELIPAIEEDLEKIRLAKEAEEYLIAKQYGEMADFFKSNKS